MSYSKVFAWIAFAAAVPGASTLLAQDRYRDPYLQQRDIDHDRRDLAGDRRDLHYDYAAIQRLRADLARDRWRLDDDIRDGRRWRVAADYRDLQRDQRALQALQLDSRHDRVDMDYDRRDLSHDQYDRWRR